MAINRTSASPDEHDDVEAETGELWFCGLCGVIGDYDFGQFIEKDDPDDRPLWSCLEGDDQPLLAYACPACQKEPGVRLLKPTEEERRRLVGTLRRRDPRIL